MTIQQALERAKQLRKERAVGSGDALVRSDASVGTYVAPQQPVPEIIPKVIQRVEFPEILPDLMECAKNRVLLNADRAAASGPAYDAYRIIRTQLRQKSIAHGWQRFAVTSAGAGEGKSTTAINLALALAREKRGHVFLLDLDLRSPSVVSYLGVNPPAEIGSFLAGQGDPGSLFFSIGVENLAISGGTQRFENSSEILSSSRLDDLFEFISSQDPGAWVIVDLPPLLATADALVLAPKVSATVVVVSEGKTRRDELERVTEMLSGAVIAGVVLNKSKQAGNNYYGYY